MGRFDILKIMKNPEGDIENKEKEIVVKKAIERIFSELTERQSVVLKMRMGVKPYDKKHTLQEIADVFGITKEPIRTQQEIALRAVTWALKKDITEAGYSSENVNILGGNTGIDNLLALIEETNPEM